MVKNIGSNANYSKVWIEISDPQSMEGDIWSGMCRLIQMGAFRRLCNLPYLTCIRTKANVSFEIVHKSSGGSCTRHRSLSFDLYSSLSNAPVSDDEIGHIMRDNSSIISRIADKQMRDFVADSGELPLVYSSPGIPRIWRATITIGAEYFI